MLKLRIKLFSSYSQANRDRGTNLQLVLEIGSLTEVKALPVVFESGGPSDSKLAQSDILLRRFGKVTKIKLSVPRDWGVVLLS